MTRRRGKGEGAGGIPAVYEGPEVLTALLRKAGSAAAAEDAARIFKAAQEAGEARSSVIPTLFEEEPRFAAPEEARRLYANLFGLWARLEAGRGLHDDAPAVVDEPPPAPPLADRGAVPGDQLPADLVEAVWKHLAAGTPRELQRRRDRFQNVQPDVTAWLETAALPEAGALAALDLAFETWSMFDQAFGERLRAVEYRELRGLEREPPPVAEVQPALAAYASEQLDVLSDEDPAFDEPARAQVEKVIATLAAAFTGAVALPN